MISRPVLTSELLKTARQRRTYALRTGLLLLVLFVGTWVVHETLKHTWRYRDARAACAELGKGLYFSLVLVMGGAVILLAPAYAGGIVTGERERRTLDLLLASDLSDREIVGDKLAGQILLVGVNLLGVLPLCFACLMLGGVSWWQLVGGVSLVIGLLLLCAGLGIFFSAISASTVVAILRAYAAIAIYLMGIPLVFACIADFRHTKAVNDYVIPIIILGNPIAALAFLVWDGGPPGPMTWLLEYAWVSAAALCAAVFAVCCYTAARCLRRDTGAPKRVRRKRLGLGRREGSDRSVWRNPVLWRAVRVGRTRGVKTLLAMAAVYVLAALIAYPKCFLDAAFHEGTVCVEATLFCLFITIAGAVAFSDEREKKTLHVLASTPLAPVRVMLGKAVGIWLRNWFVFLLPMAHSAFCVVAEVFHPASFICVCVTVSVLGVFFLTVGLLLSAVNKSNQRSLLMALAVYLGWVALMPLLGSIVREKSLVHGSPVGLVEAAISQDYPGRFWHWRVGAPPMLTREEYPTAIVGYLALTVAMGAVLLGKPGALLRLYG